MPAALGNAQVLLFLLKTKSNQNKTNQTFNQNHCTGENPIHRARPLNLK